MAPIEVFLAKGETEAHMSTLAPHQGGALTDYSGDKPEIVTFKCNGDDTGGSVDVFGSGKYTIRDQQMYVPESHLLNEAVIPQNGDYKRDITLNDGERYTLVFRHSDPT